MATIFYKTGGNFSALTPQKVVYAFLAPGTWSQTTALNAGVNVAFTPSEAGTCEGVVATFQVSNRLVTDTVTVTLQHYNGATWDDVASQTLSNNDILGAKDATATSGKLVTTYVQFAAPYAITAVAGIWRIRFVSTAATTSLHYGTGTVYAIAVALSDATVYAPGDNIITCHGTTINIDQSITAAVWYHGANTTMELVSPAASYTFTVTTMWLAFYTSLFFGRSTSKIPYAQQATIAIGTLNGILHWSGFHRYDVHFWGEHDTDLEGYLGAGAALGQPVFTTTADLSATWQAGDTVELLSTTAQSRTILSVVGTTVTLTTNLGVAVDAGTPVLNRTRYSRMGIKLGASFSAVTYGICTVFEVSGVDTYSSYFTGFTAYYSVADSQVTITDMAKVEPYLFEYLCTTAASTPGNPPRSLTFGTNAVVDGNALLNDQMGGTIIRNIYHYKTSTQNGPVIIETPVRCVVSDIFCASVVYALQVNATNSTFTNVWVINGSYTGSFYTARLFGYNNQWSGGRLHGSKIQLNGLWAFTDSVFGTGTASRYLFEIQSPLVNTTFTNCTFVSGGAIAVLAWQPTYVVALLDNCVFTGCTAADEASTGTLTAGSFIKVNKVGGVANTHRTVQPYGMTQSTGGGLTDTTVHTAGGLALRFEPTSSATNLAWSFTVPTGNIAAKTMYLSVWCKIAAAAFWAGTHEKPRLTVNFDNGTLAYAEAAASTNWQLLTVPFTPTTSYGQITVTLSCRTDATSTDAFVYWDDMGVAFPAGVSLDLGTLDNWADALPVTPPLAIPLSAQTVAGAVWDALRAGHVIVGSFGATGEWAADNTAVLAAIAALNNLSSAGAQAAAAAALAAYDAATDGDVDAAETAIIAALGSLSSLTADDVLDEPVEGTLTLRQIQRVLLAFAAGLASGGASTAVTYRDRANTKDRIALTVDASGNRTASTLDVT